MNNVKEMSMESFQNYLYINYDVITRFYRHANIVTLGYQQNCNAVRRAIGEEISDFKNNKNNAKYIFTSHIPSFDSWRYNNK